VRKLNKKMNTQIEKHVRENLPAGVGPHEYHRIVTVALLLPADEELRNAIISKLAPAESIGRMQILDVRHGFAGIELDAARQFIEDPECFAEHCGKLAIQHNHTLTLALRQEEGGQDKPRASAVPMLHPWKDLMQSLRHNLLGIAVALAAIAMLQDLFQ
jgi:hypothetical protein